MSIREFADLKPTIEASAYVDPDAVVIGQVAIGPDSSIWPGCVIRADVNSIHIGARTSIQDNSVIHVTHDGPYHPGGFPTRVGSDVTVGHRVILHGCTIADHCLIGMGAIVMDGANIESNVILAAGSLVSPGKTLVAGHLWMGVPARQIRKLTEAELAEIEYSANHYVKLKKRYSCKQL